MLVFPKENNLVSFPAEKSKLAFFKKLKERKKEKEKKTEKFSSSCNLPHGGGGGGGGILLFMVKCQFQGEILIHSCSVSLQHTFYV